MAGSDSLLAQFSSMASLNEKYLTDQITASLSGSSSSSRPGSKLPPLKIIYPTEAFVRQSLEGWQGGAWIPRASVGFGLPANLAPCLDRRRIVALQGSERRQGVRGEQAAPV